MSHSFVYCTATLKWRCWRFASHALQFLAKWNVTTVIVKALVNYPAHKTHCRNELPSLLPIGVLGMHVVAPQPPTPLHASPLWLAGGSAEQEQLAGSVGHHGDPWPPGAAGDPGWRWHGHKSAGTEHVEALKTHHLLPAGVPPLCPPPPPPSPPQRLSLTVKSKLFPWKWSKTSVAFVEREKFKTTGRLRLVESQALLFWPWVTCTFKSSNPVFQHWTVSQL